MVDSRRQIQRERLHYLFLILLTIGLGLFSRTKYIPVSIYFMLGDVLYALLIFFILGFIYTRSRTILLAFIAFTICCGVEMLQIYQEPWIIAIRQTSLGGLVLGQGFLWSDIVAYFIGVVFGVLIELGNSD